MRKAISLICMAVFAVLLFGGCQIVRIEGEPREPLTYTVVKQDDIPRELLALIAEKKEKEFQLTYQSGEDLYLIKGYGRQMSGGYSIQVEELGMTGSAVFFRTKLLEPSDLGESGGEPSYPYIVIKTAYRERTVQFE